MAYTNAIEIFVVGNENLNPCVNISKQVRSHEEPFSLKFTC